jgi:septal ring-binding cell division protein DamX
MRFEIRTFGIAGILISVLALSGAVFVMGLLAGYDIGHQSQIDTQQVAVSYPIPPAPSSAQAPAASEASVAPPPAPPAARATPLVAESKTRVASVTKPPVPAASEDEDESGDKADTADQDMESSPVASPVANRVASAEGSGVPHGARHKPFNIQIEAAMDETSAQDMARRLGSLGYQPHLLPTQINGSTWYKVEVGPYTTQEEAATAEAELRRKYNSTYGRGGAPAQPSDDDHGPEE